jgi:hypothetical protein
MHTSLVQQEAGMYVFQIHAVACDCETSLHNWDNWMLTGCAGLGKQASKMTMHCHDQHWTC